MQQLFRPLCKVAGVGLAGSESFEGNELISISFHFLESRYPRFWNHTGSSLN